MRFLQAAVFLIFLSAIGIFAVQNTEAIRLNFLSWSLSQPVALLVVGVYLLGMLSGWTVVAFVTRSVRRITTQPRN